jgi:hypothetical protein
MCPEQCTIMDGGGAGGCDGASKYIHLSSNEKYSTEMEV